MTDTNTEAVMLSAATCLLLEGKFVKEADYRALSAEVEALRAQVAKVEMNNRSLKAMIEDCGGRLKSARSEAVTARNDALREAANSSCATDFNDCDEVRVWEYAKHKILALITDTPSTGEGG